MFEVDLVIYFIILGVTVGFFAGLLGVGGGGIMVPVLSFIFTYNEVTTSNVMHLALGTSMAAIIATSFSSLMAHHRAKNVDWKLVKIMTIWVLLGTYLSTFIAVELSSVYLAVFFSLFMLSVGVKMFIGKSDASLKNKINKVHLRVTSTFIGGISALVSIGGGSLTVPYLSSKGVDIRKAIGTSAAIGFPISLGGTLGYAVHGLSMPSQNGIFTNIHLPAVIIISILSYSTAPLGARCAKAIPVNIMKKVFSCMLILLSLNMLFTML
ncbi:sulfite exporter TauE/SafE family protein [Agaribacter marinus]|uniref:Probable membrane transporter protein n=1 Tax=Agaribacter marinus TaxID=1431249 RepID=A0AA37WJN6_9ALTE|nr:sulfite exporter TauE/SafE family protein [Agaribacter marinus]GLR70369.1 UPF0721 transmembrane protein [Agaribacter marinus]